MGNNSRDIALTILYEVNEKGAYSNVAMNKNINKSSDYREQGLIREIVYGVLENRIYIDWVIKRFSKIRFRKLSPRIREILRMGVYQIMFMDRIPDSAACNESVKLSKKYGHRGSIGFVNGLLRNVVRNKKNIQNELNKKQDKEFLSIKYSHPIWLIENWIEEFGTEFTEKLLMANNSRPLLNIRVNSLKISREDLIQKLSNDGISVDKCRYAKDGIVVYNPKGITETDYYKTGLFTIQDESSMLVTEIMNPKKDSVTIDVCSAPGGKSTHMAEYMGDKGKIISRDIHDHKIELIKSNANRLGIHIIKPEVYNALKLDNSLIGIADYCLVDAPCSGLGLIRRKPEIKYNRTEKDIKELLKLQIDILNIAANYVKKGGILIYSTCTINKDENIELVQRFLKQNDFKLCPIDDLIDLDIKLNQEQINMGYLELYPNIHETDGFFIAKMVRI